jgi:diguanylate cyclase (GGDEF)-like protein
MLLQSTPSFLAVGNGPLMYLIGLFIAVNMGIAALALLKKGDKRSRNWRRVEWFCNLMVSGNRQQRILILRHLVGLANCLAGLMALNYGVSRGAVDPVACAWLTYTALVIIGLVTVMLRTGLNRHFADPTLITEHLVAATFFLAWGYYIGGPCRPVGMVLLFAVLLANFFASTPKAVVRTSVSAMVMFGAVMLRVAWEERALPNGPQIQLVYFCVLLLVLFSLYLLAHNLMHIKATSAKRKSELVAAMARIQELATRDELTSLFNRRHMQGLLDTEKSRADRTGEAFCVGIIDIDHFKRINDTHGHGAGDQVLTSVAATLMTGMRDLDVIARWGGEEFLVLFPSTRCVEAEMVLARILKTLQDTPVCDAALALRVTFSAGVTQFECGEALSHTIERADVALYQAKRTGRNRIARSESAACTGQVA